MKLILRKRGSSSIIAVILLLIIGFSFMLARSANATTNFAIFLQFDGIKGESTDDKHKDWIDVLSFDWSVTNTAGGTGAGGSGAGKAKFNEFTITKHIDTATPKLFEAVSTGKHLKTAVLDLTRSIEGQSFTYLEYKLEDILITAFAQSGASKVEPTETISFNFGKIEMIFNQLNDKGDVIQQITGGPIIVAPIPGSLLLVGSGIIGLMGIGIRQKSS